LLDHLLGSDLGSEERAFKVDRHHLVVLALGGVEHGGARFDAGIVDHDIEPAEPAYGDVNQLLQVGKLAHVGFQVDRPAAELFERHDLFLARLSLRPATGTTASGRPSKEFPALADLIGSCR